MSDQYDNEMTAVFRDAARFRHLQKGLPLTVNVPTPTDDKPNKKVTVIYGPNSEEGWGAAFAHAVDAARGAEHTMDVTPFCPICGAGQEKTTCVGKREDVQYGSEGKSVSVIVPTHACCECNASWGDYQTEAIRDFAVKEAMAANYAASAPASKEPSDDEMNAAWWQFFQDHPGTTWAENLRHLLRRYGTQVAATPGDEWKAAVLDKLAICCMDASDDTPAAKILDRIISWHVGVALDPAVSMHVHFAHCHKGQHAPSICKHGDTECPAQPVVWRWLSATDTNWEYGLRPSVDDAQPLYLHALASPVGYLSDEVIRQLDNETMFHESPDWPLRFARKVLAAASILSGSPAREATNEKLSEYWNTLCGNPDLTWPEKIREMLKQFGSHSAAARAARVALADLVNLDAQRDAKTRHSDVAVRTAFHSEWSDAIKRASDTLAGAETKKESV